MATTTGCIRVLGGIGRYRPATRTSWTWASDADPRDGPALLRRVPVHRGRVFDFPGHRSNSGSGGRERNPRGDTMRRMTVLAMALGAAMVAGGTARATPFIWQNYLAQGDNQNNGAIYIEE